MGDERSELRIDLLFFEGCPHAGSARERLRQTLDSLSLPARWREWDTQGAETPEPLRRYASPTVLVNGLDVEGKAAASGAGCAVGGGPSLEVLRRALMAAIEQDDSGRPRRA